jgi:tetratricopeptide (TPR) repeat protein
LILSAIIAGATVGADIDGKAVYAHARPSVVLITAENASGSNIALGSGFVISDGHKLVTNLHVLRNASSVKVKTADNREFSLEEALAVDSIHDLAVLELPYHLPALQEARDRPSVGDIAFTIGNPRGLEATFSQGLISGVRETPESVIYQISAPISEGSSGGPALDSQGRVIGVTTSMMRESQNLNFAVPIFYVDPLLVKKEKIRLSSLEPNRGDKATVRAEIDNLWRQGLRSLARAKAKKYVAEYWDDPNVTLHVAEITWWSGDFDASIPLFERTIELEPNAIYATVYWNYIARAHRNMRRYHEALRAFRHMGRLFNLSPRMLNEIYITQIAAGENEQAQTTLNEIEQRAKRGRDVLDLEKLAPKILGNVAAARQLLEQWRKADLQSGSSDEPPAD